MAKLKKILITPYFGDFPEWMDKFEWPEGYDHILDTDLEGFKKRVKDKLGIDFPGLPGTGKVFDYRCALGYLYSEEIKDYDYFGHCDFDMVFGDVDKWFTDEELSQLDIWSNHDTYICGPWTLYRNIPEVKLLFLQSDWYKNMIGPETTGWVEEGYSRLVEKSGLKYRYSFIQGNPYYPPFNLTKIDGKLYQDGVEIPMLHFRRTNIYPL
jgi:hypothetical protein